MKKPLVSLSLASAFALSLTACGGQATQSTSTNSDLPGSARDGSEIAIEQTAMRFKDAVDEGQYKLINTEDFKKKVDAKEDMIVIDTMPASSWEKNRVPGALNAELPVKMEDVTPEQREAFLKALGEDKNKEIIIYCGFVKCERSHVGAIIAHEEGFTNVVRHPGGIGAWLEAGYDVESGK